MFGTKRTLAYTGKLLASFPALCTKPYNLLEGEEYKHGILPYVPSPHQRVTAPISYPSGISISIEK